MNLKLLVRILFLFYIVLLESAFSAAPKNKQAYFIVEVSEEPYYGFLIEKRSGQYSKGLLFATYMDSNDFDLYLGPTLTYYSKKYASEGRTGHDKTYYNTYLRGDILGFIAMEKNVGLRKIGIKLFPSMGVNYFIENKFSLGVDIGYGISSYLKQATSSFHMKGYLACHLTAGIKF